MRRVARELGVRHGAPGEPDSCARVVGVRLLGGFSVSVGERVVDEVAWRRRKAAALVKLLALAPGHRVHRGPITDLLWPDLDARAQANNLRQVLHVARWVLYPEAPSRCLRLRGEQLELFPDSPPWVDVEAFEEAAANAGRVREPAVYRAAIELYAGDLLPGDLYEPWAEDRREGLRRTYLSLLVRLAELYGERGEYAAGIEALERVVEAEPVHEEAHAGLMRLHALAGQTHAATMQYERLREVLAPELGEPSAATRRFYGEICAGRFPRERTSGVHAAEAPSAPPPHNLPVPRDSFVGREREVSEVERELAMTRLLTLTGAGGAGKTRLALEVARGLSGAYPDGAWLVELAPLPDGDLVPQAVAAALRVREQPGRPLEETLAGHLRSKGLLLVLDNCEHVVDTAARLADGLLSSCAELRVLATSREALRVGGEVVWRVPSLSTPEVGDEISPEELLGYESARLFAERARARRPDFGLRRENARAVAGVCRRLDGMPLAIELAAARVGVLSADQISSRLSDSLGLLRGGSRTAPSRHQTLRGMLDWGHALLPEPEKRLFGRLSVFAVGFSLEAAEAVGKGAGEDDVLVLLESLVDKSLVAAKGPAHAVRHRLLEPVRQYAWEKLEGSGEAEEARRRHALWYLALVEEAEAQLSGQDQAAWLDRLETEHDNLRGALGWALDGGNAELGLRLAGALWLFWDTRGHLAEGRAWLEKALSRSGAGTSRARAKALIGVGWILISQGRYEMAVPLLEDSLALYRELGDKGGIAGALTNLGFASLFGMRDDPSLDSLLMEAMSLRPELEDHRTLGKLLIFAGMIREAPEGGRRGEALHEEGLRLFREVRDVWGMSTSLTSLGIMALQREEHARAEALLLELLRLSCGLDKKVCIAYSFFGLASVAADRGRPVRAVRLWAASETVREAAGIRLSPLARSAVGYENLLEGARARLGDEAFEEAWIEGRTMGQDGAVRYALAEAEPPERESAANVREGSLTRREGEIAALVARGLTNRRISSELTLSRRTVENHVAKILKKLGVSSREQVAGRLKGAREVGRE